MQAYLPRHMRAYTLYFLALTPMKITEVLSYGEQIRVLLLLKKVVLTRL